MSFKINDLDKFLKEDYEDLDEPMHDVGSEFEKFADVPEDVDAEELEVPAEASNVEEGGYELEDRGDDSFFVTYDGKPVCSVVITCEGKPQNIADVIDPSTCVASFFDIVDSKQAVQYMQKLESMGYTTTSAIPPK